MTTSRPSSLVRKEEKAKYEEISNCSRLPRAGFSARPRLASPSNVRNEPFPTTRGLPPREKAAKRIARNACEKVQSRILHLAFRVSKRRSIEKSASCASAFSVNELVSCRGLDKCNVKCRAPQLELKSLTVHIHSLVFTINSPRTCKIKKRRQVSPSI